ncbi:MAG: YtxH domain-containing protein [Gemmatimonadales bacterium]
MGRDDREIVVVERDGGGALKWLVVGAALGAGLALLFAPKTGKELRRELGRGIKGIRDLADETLEELSHDPTTERELRNQADEGGASAGDEAEDEAPPRRPGARPRMVAAREELDRRLEAARARRRQAVPDDEEEPVA